MRTVRRIVLSVVAVVALLAGSVAAVYLLPTTVLLGPCLKDFTSPLSYRHRPSPLGSTTMRLGDGAVRVCYGRPSARSRRVFGGLVLFGQYWRVGANEPTRLYTSVPLRVAGVRVPAGRYSLYAVPGADSWEVAVNRSIFHWGTDFSESVLSREVGRGTVTREGLGQMVETLELRLEPAAADSGSLAVEWEQTRVVIPVVVDR